MTHSALQPNLFSALKAMSACVHYAFEFPPPCGVPRNDPILVRMGVEKSGVAAREMNPPRPPPLPPLLLLAVPLLPALPLASTTTMAAGFTELVDGVVIQSCREISS